MRIQLILIASLLFIITSKAAETNRFIDWQKDPKCTHWVDSVYNSLTLEERIAQFFMLPAYTQGDKQNMRQVQELIKNHKAGGVIFFKGKVTEQARWTNDLQREAQVPLFVAIDGEWGLAMRLDSTIAFPKQMTLGAIRNNNLIYQMGSEIGNECKRLGLQTNFSPDIDVNTNPNNPVINDRSFGDDKYKVALKGLAYMQGLQDVGVLSCVKHFPGHGSTDKDSHQDLPTVNRTYEQLKNVEFYPFRALFKNGVGSVMVAHLNMPALDTSSFSIASLSHRITHDLLKDTMGFKGLVFSDALNMKGVSKFFDPGTLDSIAFMAGNDILVFSEDATKGIQKLVSAVDSGAISQNEIETRVKKVLGYKYTLGLNQFKPIETENLLEDLNNDKAKVLRQHLFENAITIPANKDNLLPLKTWNYNNPAIVAINFRGTSEFQKTINSFYETKNLYLGFDNDKEGFDRLFDSLQTSDLIVIELHGMSRFAQKNYAVSENTIEFLKKITTLKAKVVLTVFGSPYSLKYFETIDNIILTYEDNETTRIAAANALLGGIQITGTLPVNAGTKFKNGDGFLFDTVLKLKISNPEDAGFSTEDLHEMDNIVLSGIIGKAYPGCQVLVSKDGKVIWNKAYGNKTYETQYKVTTTDLYDLASITKIGATTLCIMKLYEEGKLALTNTIADYLPLPKEATVGNIKLKDLLLHQAGLTPFIEFYKPLLNQESYYRCFRRQRDNGFGIMVADSICIRNDYPDSMWYKMITSELKPNPKYIYSDLDFYILQKVVEKITGKPLNQYAEENFYSPMGLKHLTFLPLQKFPKEQIVPTENDKFFRKQIVQGYVHDPGSAMYGGVAGHAGLFGDALDLAAVMEMLLNGGTYNGKQFLKEETIKLFTSRQSSISRRGLGFDKPEPDKTKASPCSEIVPDVVFGHTGFTGTCVWSDPENHLTFIFLSNRVYPDADNPRLVNMGIRTRLQELVYKAMKKGEKK